MITVRFRLAAAVAAVALIAFACYVLLHAKRPIAAVLFAPAAVLSLPLFASGRPPRRDEWAALNDNVARFRTSGLICFTIAILVHSGMLALDVRAPLAEPMAAFGVAWWAVGFGLIPFALYFALRRALLEDDTTD